MKHEGGYVFDPDDSGGETYKGVARKFHSKWEGWSKIDLHSQLVAQNLFDFAVNAGVRTASKIAQTVIESNADGILGQIV